MITSMASQYLQPDYLQPLPTTLDAKKSPLALLAQTCSSIGKDSGSAKSIIPPIEKKDKDKDKSDSPSSKSGSADDKGRTSTSASDKRDGTPGSSRGNSPKGGFRAPAPKDIPPLVPISSASDKSSAMSTSDRTTPKASTSSSSPSSSSDRDRETTSVTSVLQHSVAATSTTSVGAHSNSRISLSCGNMLLEVNHQESAAKALGLSPAHPALHGSLKGDGLATPSALHAGLGAYSSLPFFGHPIPMDLASSMYSSLPGHGSLGSMPKAGMSPYVSYARVKTSSGATTLVPVCKDPYCAHCQMTMQGAQLSSQCGAGCTQCTHDKSFLTPTSLSAHSALGSMALFPNSAASLSLSSLYPHTLGMLPGHSGLPYVCNWVGGSEYCGKRFSTSEELLQHLRTHTSSSDAAAALAHAGLSHSALAPGLAGCHSHYPGSLSPSALRQSYPRSLSPNTLLAASRFHPYKSPLSSLPTPGSGLSAAGLQSLGAYYSPYALYGQRMGAVGP